MGWRRERIPVDRARRLYDELGSWRKVADALPRSTGQKFAAAAIANAVRWADQGYAGTVNRARLDDPVRP
jgi:hypothetical protein